MQRPAKPCTRVQFPASPRRTAPDRSIWSGAVFVLGGNGDRPAVVDAAVGYNAAPDGWWQDFVRASPARTGKLAVTRLDGSPHVAPVWVDLDGEGSAARLVFMTSADTIKGKSILRDGRVAVCFDDEAPPFSFATITGTTTTSTDPDELLRWGSASPHGTWVPIRPRRTDGAMPCPRRWSCGSPRPASPPRSMSPTDRPSHRPTMPGDDTSVRLLRSDLSR